MPCRTLCHSELFVDCHFLKFHGSFLFCSFFSRLLVVHHRFRLYILYYLLCTNSLNLDQPPFFPSTMGKLDRLKLKRAERATARKARKSEADAAAAADATAAAAAAAAFAAADTAVVLAAPSGSGIGTHCSYAAAVADGTAVAVVATSVNAAAVASPSSAITRSSKKPTLSASALVLAVIVDT